jgi:hypothetical protein
MNINKSVPFISLFNLPPFLFLFLFPALLHASTPVATDVTIDSPAEVIADDFLNVAVVPPSWFYLLYNWLGTFDIDPNSITNNDIDKYVTDIEKKEKVKKAIAFINEFDTYPGEQRIIKWQSMPINISLTHEPEMDDAIRQTVKLIEENTTIRFKIHEERIAEDGITVDTYGLKKEHTDHCVHDYACTDLVIHGSTTYFKGDGGLMALDIMRLDYFINTPDINRKKLSKNFLKN